MSEPGFTGFSGLTRIFCAFKSFFAVLAENWIISDKTLSFLVPMAGTGNILVHNYDRIDDSILYGILKKHLEDFTVYLNEIKTYILLNTASEKENT